MYRNIILFVFFISCNEPAQKEIKVGQDQQDTADVNVDTSSMLGRTECFWKISQKDTLVAVLLHTGNQVTGRLSFDNFQKDGSTGSVSGTVEDDVIKLWYSFQSEGRNSVMETWYKREEDKLLRGFGPTAVKGDSSYFTDHAAIRFTNDQVLQKTSCDSIPAKYK